MVAIAFRAVVSAGLALLASPLCAQTSLLRQSLIDVMRGYPIARTAADDFDGDGLTDLAGITFDSAPGLYSQTKVLVQRQLADGFHDQQVLYASAPQDLLVTDLDADGDVDLAVVQDDPADALAIWLNQGGVQGGPPGQLNRLPLSLAQDLAVRAVALDVDANPATPPALLLVRAIGRDALLYATHVQAPTPELQLLQSLPHPGAIGVATADVDRNGGPDLLIYGDGCRLWMQPGPGGASYTAANENPCGVGTVYAAALAVPPAAGPYFLALARSSGDEWLRVAPGSTFSMPLSSATTGITRDFAFIDADGDADLDLLAARANENAVLAAERGSPVYRRVGDSFEGSLQTVQSAWSAASLSLGAGASGAIVLAHPLRSTAPWQPQPVSALTPVVQFIGNASVYPAPGLVAFLGIQPFTLGPTSVHISAASAGQSHQWSEDLGPGVNSVAADAPVTTIAPSTWTLSLTSIAPVGAGVIGPNNSTRVQVVQPELSEGACYLESLFQLMASLLGAAPDNLQGVSELDQLRRMRDEKLAATAAGQHYIALYQTLQPDLYAATVADPQFAVELWALKDAFMPAINNLLDGNGQALIDAPMQSALSAALNRFAAHASPRLLDAVARERRALDLDHLQGQPIATLQTRWEQSPLSANGWE